MAGIDYSGGSGVNMDKKTGIRYGVINLNSEGVSEWAWESFESAYGPATCGYCGNKLADVPAGRFPCPHCGKEIDEGMGDCWGEEPIGWELADGEYLATASSDGDAFIIKSPYYTFADFCSPCAPGACHLSSPSEDGEKTYCFGHDFFSKGVAPYAVYRVDNGQRVYPTVTAAREKGNDVPN